MRSNDNYLDYVFHRDPDLSWNVETNDDESDDYQSDGLVVLHVRHRGFSHAIARKFFDRPAVTSVHLEPFGSFIWQQIDGTRTVYEIGQCLHDAFGEEAEPLYERLTVYMKQLERNGFISRS